MNKRGIFVSSVAVLSMGVAIFFAIQDSCAPLHSAYSQEKDGYYEKAVETYTNAILQNSYKNDPRYYLARGRCQTKLKKYNDAIADLDKALALSVDNFSWNSKSRRYGHSLLFDIWYEKGWAHRKSGEPQIAVDLYNKALAEQKDEHVLFDRALAYEDLNMLKEAEADLSEAVKYNSGWEPAVHEHGIVLNKQGKKQEAVADLKEAIRLNACPTAYCDLGIIEKEMGNLDNALENLNAAIKGDPKMERAYHVRALVNYDRGRFDQARADITNAALLDPACKFLPADKRRIYAENQL